VNVAAALMPRRASRLLLLAVLAALGIAVQWFMRTKLHYFNISKFSYGDYFWPRRTGLVPHIFGGLLASSVGLVQIWLGLTGRTGTLHQLLGRWYVLGVLIGSFGGFYLVFTIPLRDLVYAGGLLALCGAWVFTTGMALHAIYHGRRLRHRNWMLRSYVVTFAFVTFRMVSGWLRDGLPLPPVAGADGIDDMMSWACWIGPLVIAEPFIQLSSPRHLRH
jgi:hypothetical protein